ncbi:MAG: TIGR03619 family F420-dependent LLM class oxidoreductase [Candidatus Rokubacteria bacterium]|nr:TIGR03619 family F420-dependent LLM class oxidoreductase [Candidatus Rokubacteria bacterium]
MKFGINLPHFATFPSKDAILRVARRAEELGYDSIWVTDHIGVPEPYVPRFGAVFYEPLSILAYVAAHTSRIRLGTSVLILPYRNPLFVAKAIATIDQLSDGRVIFGVGTGWCQEEFEALSVPFRERGARATESLRIMKTIWTSDRPAFDGKYHRFSKVSFLPRPRQAPHPPIWVGGKSEGAMRRAAELGDGWHPNFSTPDELAVAIPTFQKFAREYGRDPSALTICLRGHVQIHDRREAWTEKYPMTASVDYIVKSLQRYREVGVSYMNLDLFYGLPELGRETLDSVLRTMERFQAEIAPQVAG